MLIKVSLKDFVRTGVFGSIKLGAKRSIIEQQLGAPENWDAGARGQQNASIWKYGAVEFHFCGNMLEMIFIDDFSDWNASQSFAIEAWAIGENLSCAVAEQRLDEAKLLIENWIFLTTKMAFISLAARVSF